MKILIVRTFPSIIDSKTYNVQEIGLAKAFVRLGHECAVVLYNGNNKNVVEEINVTCEKTTKKVIIYRLKGFNILKNGFFPSLQKIAKKYDIIQVHEYDQITSWFYYAWSKQSVTIYHGPYFNSFNKGYNIKCKIFDNTFLRIKNNKNALFLTKSMASADFLIKKGFCNVIPVGVGLDMNNFTDNKEYRRKLSKSTRETFRWLYVGKIEPRRNSLFLLDIMEELINKHSNMEFIIVGNGSGSYEEKWLQRLNNLKMQGNIKYIAKATQSELALIYQEADAMLFPSVYEIFGMVLMEAMYFELPVISSQNGGADMLYTNMKNAILIDDFNKDIWVKKAEELYSNNELYSLICTNLEKDKYEKLSWENVAMKMLNAYSRNFEKGSNIK